MTVAALLVLNTAFAQGEDFRLPSELENYPAGLAAGLVLGAPTGLSVAWRDDTRDAYTGAVAWSVKEKAIQVHADYQYNLISWDDPNAPEVGFPIYVGLGARIRIPTTGIDWTPEIAIRFPLGVTVLPPKAPVDLFFELVPGIRPFPERNSIKNWYLDTDGQGYGTLEGGMGIRYYFL